MRNLRTPFALVATGIVVVVVISVCSALAVSAFSKPKLTQIPTPTPTLTPTPTPIPPPNIKGIWEGCIQGYFLHPNEQITLDVKEENPDGTFSAVYGENWHDTILGGNSIVGNWDVYNSEITLGGDLRFAVNVVWTFYDGTTTNKNYDFRGSLDGAGSKLSGKETDDGNQHDWTLSRSGGCPYP